MIYVQDVEGIEMEIPMPGHFSSSKEDCKKLENLIKENDIIFLLTDSRESRWLPTLLATCHKKEAILLILDCYKHRLRI